MNGGKSWFRMRYTPRWSKSIDLLYHNEQKETKGQREKNSSLLNLYDKNCDLQQGSVLYGRKWKLQKYRERVARAHSSAGCLSYREASSRLNFHFSLLRCGIRQFSDSARYSSLATNLSCLLDRKSVGE